MSNPITSAFAEFANYTETSDAPASIATPYSISVGDTFTGSIGAVGERDWVAVNLVAGQAYTFSLSGSAGGGGTLSDPRLYLMNNSGTETAGNDADRVMTLSSLIRPPQPAHITSMRAILM